MKLNLQMENPVPAIFIGLVMGMVFVTVLVAIFASGVQL